MMRRQSLFYWSCAAIIMLQFISADIWGLFHNPLRHQLLVSHLTAGMVPSSATARAHRVADRVGAADVRIRPLAGLSLGLQRGIQPVWAGHDGNRPWLPVAMGKRTGYEFPVRAGHAAVWKIRTRQGRPAASAAPVEWLADHLSGYRPRAGGVFSLLHPARQCSAAHVHDREYIEWT